MVQIELGKAYIPESVLREIERAIQAAEFPRGMSVHDGKAKVDSSHLRRLLAELAALRAELESAHAAQRHAETELSQYMAWYAMAEHQHLHEQRLREKAEAERDAALVAVKAMHKLLDRDWAIVDRDITLRCESHDQAWNYLHEMHDLVRAALENVMPYKEPQP